MVGEVVACSCPDQTKGKIQKKGNQLGEGVSNQGGSRIPSEAGGGAGKSRSASGEEGNIEATWRERGGGVLEVIGEEAREDNGKGEGIGVGRGAGVI
ncbi:hypothetical protein AMTR_s00013p00189840 [Amborella trichopoda]|uniref:Uncharacterized protein n=1 Tax=Amborella trichopoda TaxID=13333 RepID=W1PIX6_AMBTC|nr:hypothetical protein AMTR_s00013p00189840 [Amborella trichopoda]